MASILKSAFSRLFALCIGLLPHHLLSSGVHALTRLQVPGLTTVAIRLFIRLFGVDMQQAAQSDPAAYPSFNAFFTRALRPDARPLAAQPGSVLCPVDGTVSEAGRIEGQQIFQAKGHHYSLPALLADDNGRWSRQFRNGSFVTLYLSPRDYHRIHMPLAGRLQAMTHIPGRLFSVNAASVRYVPGLFARNERLATFFTTEAGPMALILVGALFVSSIETVWSGPLPRRARGLPQQWEYDPGAAPQLDRGAEMGRFNMGSTVIVLFGPDHVNLAATLRAGESVRMGQLLADRPPL